MGLRNLNPLADAAIAAHEAASDPHTGYALESSFFSYGDIPSATPGTAAINFLAGGTTAAQRAQNGAFIAFHRPGIAANYFGLSVYNDLRFGGWSNPGSSWRVWHEYYGVPVWQSPSDPKLKKGIRPINSALALILATKPISFEYKKNSIGNWSESEYQRKKVHYGFSAEDFPITDLVSQKDNGFLGLDYVEIIPFLVRSLQELHIEIEELAKRKSQLD